jgi:4-hydroxy-3-polyprenylbenzoate decarboxylase
MRIEGPFGDHTGYYTLEEPYPVMEVSAITRKKEPVFLATVVGKPPLEDKYMGWATERIFLPLLKTNAPDLIDYHMPENGVFHNLILAKMQPLYKGHAKQFMHVFWGAGQMSFVKHALFVDEKGPELGNYFAMAKYVLDRFSPKMLFVSEGITDALDHSSPEALVGGKLGIDATLKFHPRTPALLDDEKLLALVKERIPEAEDLRQYMLMTPNPITVITVNKTRRVSACFELLDDLNEHLRIVVFVDVENNNIDNAYMLTWRIVNNLDAQRDIRIAGESVYIDGTNKNSLDGFERRWPDDVTCTPEVVASLRSKGLWNLDPKLETYYQL